MAQGKFLHNLLDIQMFSLDRVKMFDESIFQLNFDLIHVEEVLNKLLQEFYIHPDQVPSRSASRDPHETHKEAENQDIL